MYRPRFIYVYGLLVAFAFAAVAAGLLAIANSVGDPIVRTREVRQPALTAKSSVKDARARYAKSAQTVDGQQLGLPAGTACDVYELSDGLSLVCYRGGA